MLEPTDFVEGFPTLVPLLREALGDIFHHADLYTILDKPISISSESYTPVPTSGNMVTPNWPVRLVVTITAPYIYHYQPRPYQYKYHVFGLNEYTTIAEWSSKDYRKEIYAWIQRLTETKAMANAKACIAPIKEELIAAAWAPHRVERLIAAGGLETLD
jgi:hypothetical protein